MNDEEWLKLARRVCTKKQYEALYWRACGYGKKRIARVLRISPQAVDARLDGAERKLAPYRDEESSSG